MFEIVVFLVIPAGAIMALVLLFRGREVGHSDAARRFGIVGGVLGIVVAGFWAGRYLGLW